VIAQTSGQGFGKRLKDALGIRLNEPGQVNAGLGIAASQAIKQTFNLVS
jgi:hypothetical protein